jgi:hypothetical protein
LRLFHGLKPFRNSGVVLTYDLSQTRAAERRSIRFGSKLEAREVGEIIVLLNMSWDGV